MEKVSELGDYLIDSERYHYGLIMLVEEIDDAVTAHCLEGSNAEKGLKAYYNLLKDALYCMRERGDIFMDENVHQLPEKIRKLKKEIWKIPENHEDITRKNAVFDEIVETIYNSMLFCRLTNYRLSLLEVAYNA